MSYYLIEETHLLLFEKTISNIIFFSNFHKSFSNLRKSISYICNYKKINFLILNHFVILKTHFIISENEFLIMKNVDLHQEWIAWQAKTDIKFYKINF